MRLQALGVGLLLVLAPLLGATDDALKAPEELRKHVFRVTALGMSPRVRLQALLKSLFDPPEAGGLGIVYDNDHTRTIPEVMADRKANCLSLTLLFVAACEAMKVKATYAEVLNMNHWVRKGDLILFEQHVVALVPMHGTDDLVADFLPRIRKRWGAYVVAPLSEVRIRALFESNRAVECLEAGDQDEALVRVRTALAVDPACSPAWNVLGVVQRAVGDLPAAEKAYLKALELDGNNGSAMGNMESLLRQEDREAEADGYRNRGQETRKKDPYYNAHLADEALGSGDLKAAAEHIDTALRLLPYESEFYVLQARLRLAKGDVEGAEKSLEQAQHWAKPGERERFDSKLDLLRKAAAKEDEANVLPDPATPAPAKPSPGAAPAARP
jgi:Flp pilus assembly protein TadD